MTSPTGRQPSGPNMQGIPHRSPEVAEVRQAFKMTLGQYLAQAQEGERIMRSYHEKMIAAGFEWDGMDGYVAPPGFTKESGDELWQAALAAFKDGDKA